MMRKVAVQRLFALYTGNGLLLSYNPSSCEYHCVYRRYELLKVWDYLNEEQVEFWFKGQPIPKEQYVIKEIPLKQAYRIFKVNLTIERNAKKRKEEIGSKGGN